MVELIPVESSNIEAVGHDPAAKVLFVRFVTGETWRYDGVSSDTYGQLLAADSKGTFFARYVKGVCEGQSLGHDGAPLATVYDMAVACPACGTQMTSTRVDRFTLTCRKPGCRLVDKEFKAPARRVELEAC